MGQPSRKRLTPCRAPLLALTMLFLLTSYVLDLHAALALTYLGSISSASPLGKFVQPVSMVVLPFSPFLPNGIRCFLKTSMAHSTMEAYECVCRLVHGGKFADPAGNKKPKAATTLLRDVDVERLGNVQWWSLVKSVHFRPVGENNALRGGDQRLLRGVYVGHHARSGASMFLTPDGVKR